MTFENLASLWAFAYFTSSGHCLSAPTFEDGTPYTMRLSDYKQFMKGSEVPIEFPSTL